jgi:hypothetical protein
MIMLDNGGEASGFLAGITAAVDELAAATAGDGFAINEEAGKDLQAAILRLQEVLREGLQWMSRLDHEPPPLGTSPAATLYKSFIPTIAGDPAQGSIAAFKRMQHDLQVAHDAIGESITRYREADHGGAGDIIGIDVFPGRHR